MAQIRLKVFEPYSLRRFYTNTGGGKWNSILSGLAHIVSFEISDNMGFKHENYQ